MKKEREMEVLYNKLVDLKRSPLYRYRTQHSFLPVLGEGSLSAHYMFIGEAPGRNEAKSGRPFCGAAGKILDTLLESGGLKRSKIYITNIVKDRPPENRDPSPKEIRVYGPFLDEQIEIVKPKVLVALGRYSYEYVLKKFGLEQSIRLMHDAHGTQYSAQASYGPIIIVALYHPCAAIYNRKLLPVLTKDIALLKKLK